MTEPPAPGMPEPDDVPDEWVLLARKAWDESQTLDQQVRSIVAAVLPEHERQVREQVARETRSLARKWAANAQASATLTGRERRFAVANALTEHADDISRGETP